MPIASHKETDARNTLEQQPHEVAEPALRVSLSAHLRVDPDLLELDGTRRPRRRLRLEEDRPVLDPDPRAALLDLLQRAPAEALGVGRHRIEAELAFVGRSAGRKEQLEVGARRLADPRRARLGRVRDREDRLTWTVLARLLHP